MNREFFINVVFVLAINLLIKPFYIFGIDRVVQNTVEPGSYGLYFALFNFTFLFQIINDFGLRTYNNRIIAQDPSLLEKYFPNLLFLQALLGIVYLVAILIFGYLLGYAQQYAYIMMLLGVCWILIALVLLLRSNISGLAMYRTDSMLSALDKIFLIAICGVLLWTPSLRSQFKIEWFIYAQIASLLLTAGICFLVVLKKIKKLQFKFQPHFWREILRKSLPYALAVFLMTVYSRIDGVMIERILEKGKLEADLYASAYRLLDAASMVGYLFAGLLLPMFTRQLKAKEAVNELVRFSLQLLWAGAITACIAIICFREDIMVLLYNNGSAYSGDILGYLMLSFIAITGSYIYGTLLVANDSLRKMNVIFIISLFINLTLNFVLIPKHQALGAAIATCITQFFVLIGQVHLSKTEVGLNNHWRLVARLLTLIVLMLFGSYAILQWTAFNWMVQFILLNIYGIAISFLLKLIDFRGLEIFSSK